MNEWRERGSWLEEYFVPQNCFVFPLCYKRETMKKRKRGRETMHWVLLLPNNSQNSQTIICEIWKESHILPVLFHRNGWDLKGSDLSKAGELKKPKSVPTFLSFLFQMTKLLSFFIFYNSFEKKHYWFSTYTEIPTKYSRYSQIRLKSWRQSEFAIHSFISQISRAYYVSGIDLCAKNIRAPRQATSLSS